MNKNTHEPKPAAEFDEANQEYPKMFQPSAPCLEVEENSNSRCSKNMQSGMDRRNTSSGDRNEPEAVESGSFGPVVEEGFRRGRKKEHLRKNTKTPNNPEQNVSRDQLDGGMISKRHDDDEDSSDECADSSDGPGAVQEDGIRRKKRTTPSCRVDRTSRFAATGTTAPGSSGTRGSTVSVSSTTSGTSSTGN